MKTDDDALKLVPRAYQEEIFHKACKENVIAVLSTGSGKTFIAALLIKWMMAQPSSAGKKAFFLVPKVPLVTQQRDFLSQHTPLAVRGYMGAMGIDDWSSARWKEELASADCLVMTAQILKNILTHGFWHLENISILVFDECHHARGQHPYNTIMTDHFNDCEERPKVFGMTASPILDPKRPEESIALLQSNLHSTIICVQKHTEELEGHINRPAEVLLKYQSPPAPPIDSEPTLWQELQCAGLLNIPGILLDALHARHKAVLNAIGPVAADRYLATAAIDKIHALSESETACTELADDEIEKLRQSLESLKSLVADTDARMEETFRRREIDISPKVAKLVDLLNQHKNEGLCAIVFVEQRQVAMSLAWFMTMHSETRDWVKCKVLMGHGDRTSGGDGMLSMSMTEQRNVVAALKSGEINLLFATSVAEEGLDFRACELVICFDPPKNHQAYVQTRGRARQRRSTFVVMVNNNDQAEIDRYERFRVEEENFKDKYQRSNGNHISLEHPNELESDEEDEAPKVSEGSRNAYIVKSTGATLTYSSAIGILEHLCSLIPRDAYTPILQPKYTLQESLPEVSGYKFNLRLPFAIPLSSEYQEFVGPTCPSKGEAKQAVAFQAARVLAKLGVLDEHLLPTKPRAGKVIEDADNGKIDSFDTVSEMMDVWVVSPWKVGPPWFFHLVHLDGVPCAGLVSGSQLPEVDVTFYGQEVKMFCADSEALWDLKDDHIRLLTAFTKNAIWWCVSPSSIPFEPTCFLCPINERSEIDWTAITSAVPHEKGIHDWESVSEAHEGKVMLMNGRKFGRSLRFLRYRTDLSLHSTPPADENGDNLFASYVELFEHKYPQVVKKDATKPVPERPPSGRLLEVTLWPRCMTSDYALFNGSSAHPDDASKPIHISSFLLPESFCRRALFGKAILDAFHVFRPLCQRICDVYRARIIRDHLVLPSIPTDLIIEATTIPASFARFNNQRLETIGDSVLKLCVITYIFNKFKEKHEGQLEAIKSNSVCNRLLMTRARQIQLENFLSCEVRRNRLWSFVIPPADEASTWSTPLGDIPVVKRNYARRSLQDCMEALLGASYVSGGIDCALQTGHSLRLCFGGPQPWCHRWKPVDSRPTAPLFIALQNELGYQFTDGCLLVEAFKHPSFDAEEGPCYQRLEFLGDAVVELVVTTYLFNKFPNAQSGRLSWIRARAICNTTLAALTVKRLSLHKYLLANNVSLNKDIVKEVPLLLDSPYEDLVSNDWRYDPPKVLADIFESLIGAIFVDSRFDYPKVASVVERLMEDVLEKLHMDIPYDPVSNLLQWAAKNGCQKVRFMKSSSNPVTGVKDLVSFLVHDQVVAGPLNASNRPRARGMVAEAAHAVLSDPSSHFELLKICTCKEEREEKEREKALSAEAKKRGEEEMNQEEEPIDEEVELRLRDIKERKLDVHTTHGCALTGALRAAETEAEEEEKTELSHGDEDESSGTNEQAIDVAHDPPYASCTKSGLSCAPDGPKGDEMVQEQELVDMLVRASPFSAAAEVNVDDQESLGDDCSLFPTSSQASTYEVEMMLSESMDID